MSNLAAYAAARTVSDIRTLATSFRDAIGVEPNAQLPIAAIMEFALPRMLPDYVMAVRTRAEMGDDLGLAQPDRNFIAFREDVYDGLLRGEGRDRFTASHELGHLILHQRENLLLPRSGRASSVFTDPEWQANTFAAELLMDHRACAGLSDPHELCNRFGVGVHAAKIRLKLLGREGSEIQNADARSRRVRARSPNRQKRRT
jgi:Zn-dependent peptidase ImmA (M78 family)